MDPVRSLWHKNFLEIFIQENNGALIKSLYKLIN